MGGYLLRGEILRAGSKIFTSGLFLLCIAAAWAEDEGRAVRGVRPAQGLAVFQPQRTAAQTPPSAMLTDAVLEQPLVQHYITQYSSPGGIAWLNAVLERGSLYLPYIKEEIKKRNMPPELAYLPVIESGFQITARSRSGAVGLWQFMLNSVSPFDIKVNEFVDERRDIIKSTAGALQKLDDNYKTLGNWELALAAYNYGLGGINRIIHRTGSRDYWELCKRNELRNETVHYVPKFYAAAYILSQPRRFGIDDWQKNPQWTAIPINRQISLDILASEAGIDLSILRRLNAELLHGISPSGADYRLKVPEARLSHVSEVLQREDLKLIRYHYHVVRSGDTLWSMSRHYETPLEVIEQHNPGVTGRYLRLGETLIIPAFKDIKPPERQVVNARFDGRHTVTRGDTLWSLGLKYGVDPQILAEENNMALNEILREGRTIKVPIIE
jgi:membrane-bound lytic murein transglycosylase D